MFTTFIAIISNTQQIGFSQLAQAAAAIQKQITQDVAQHWNVEAIVTAFPSVEDMPEGYWPVFIVDKVQNAGGYHLDENGQPYSVVQYDSNWTITASHECLEMLVDPFGNRMVPGYSPIAGQGMVNFLVEVCDPSEAYSYTQNGIPVSDFYTRHFFDNHYSPNVKYSHMGVVAGPLQVMPGGYLSWYVPATNQLWQAFNIKGVIKTRSFDNQKPPTQSMRAYIDSVTTGTITFTDNSTMSEVTFNSKALDAGTQESIFGLRGDFRAESLGAVSGSYLGHRYEMQKIASKVRAEKYRKLL